MTADRDAQAKGPFIPDHAVARFAERFLSDVPSDLWPRAHEIRMTLLEAWSRGTAWGATAGDGETRLTTLADGTEIVLPTRRNQRHGTLELRTVLTKEQAIVNQQMAFAGRWSHALVSQLGAPPRSKRRRRR